MTQGSTRFKQLLDEALALQHAKNAGYAGVGAADPWANFREAKRFGVHPFIGVLIRISDKYTRIGNLVQNPEADQVNERIVDTLFDMAIYCLIAICIWEEGEVKQ
jgi:hypothetical protein